MKVYISMPMNGKTDEQIKNELDAISERLKLAFVSDIEVISSFINKEAPVKADRAGAWYLGESLKMIAQADLVYFAEEWFLSRGCTFERDVCLAYKIPIIFYDDIS